MGRHSKNNSAGSNFTAYERRLAHAKWGSKQQRIGEREAGNWDACGLCLAAVASPSVVCQEGHLFCRGCIVENLATQKLAARSQLEEWERAQKKEARNVQLLQQEEQQRRLEKFDQGNNSILVSSAAKEDAAAAAASAASPLVVAKGVTGQNMVVVNKDAIKQAFAVPSSGTFNASETQKAKEALRKALPSPWLPSLAPEHVQHGGPQKPSMQLKCPRGDHPIRLKQLCSIQWTRQNDVDHPDDARSSNAEAASAVAAAAAAGASTSEAAGDDGEAEAVSTSASASVPVSSSVASSRRYQCSSCTRALSNRTVCICLKRCGHIVCAQCADRFVAKDKVCVACGAKAKPGKDWIRMTKGGSHFAGGGASMAKSRLAPEFHT